MKLFNRNGAGRRTFCIAVYLALMCVMNINAYAQTTFVITDIPISTPPEDSIFICGTFNDWRTDSKLVLHKRLDGKYSITLPIDSAFEYKFHRGDWATVETSAKNKYLPNRIHKANEHGPVLVEIENWQDLGGAKPFDVTTLYFFAVAFPSMAAAYFLNQIKNKRKNRIRTVTTFLLFVALILLGRVFMEIVSLPNQYRIGNIGMWSVLIGAPLWYAMILSVLTKEKVKQWVWIVPSIAGLFLIVRLVFPTSLDFLTRTFPLTNTTIDEVGMMLLLFIHTCVYVVMTYQLVRRSATHLNYTMEERQFVRSMLFTGGAFLVIIFILNILPFASQVPVLWISRNGLVVGASIFALVLCYYAFTHDEIFRVTSNVLKKSDDLESLKALLHQRLNEQRLYTNPHLSLQELADSIHVKPHVLSKIINECHHLNFRDFINRYRIEAFIDLAKKDSSKRFTFLALAFEVGFNSKSTFNAAFKKVTNVTPREYFQSSSENSLEHKPLQSADL